MGLISRSDRETAPKEFIATPVPADSLALKHKPDREDRCCVERTFSQQAAEKSLNEGYGLQPVHYGNRNSGLEPLRAAISAEEPPSGPKGRFVV
jgi:hypothetical protein